MAPVPATKVYVWDCPRCKKSNVASEPYDPEQACSNCGEKSTVGPLLCQNRMKALSDRSDIGDFAEAAMTDCKVSKGRREHMYKVIMRVFELAFSKVRG